MWWIKSTEKYSSAVPRHYASRCARIRYLITMMVLDAAAALAVAASPVTRQQVV